MMNAYTYIKFTYYIVNPKNPNIVKREREGKKKEEEEEKEKEKE
jgi:hypothetical protein